MIGRLIQRNVALSTQASLFSKNNSISAGVGKPKDQLIYKIQIHEVKPEYEDEYEELASKQYLSLHKDENLPQKLVGSFRVIYGAQDEIIHIWRYDGGYSSIKKASDMINSMPEYTEYRKQRAHQLHRRTNQLLIQFDNWPYPIERSGFNIYEMRSYKLKSGKVGEWHYNWANIGLKCRDPSELVTGMFTNAGELNLVHHFWCYKDLEERDQIRAKAWEHHRWGEHIRNTTPMIKQIESRLLKPLSWSPLK